MRDKIYQIFFRSGDITWFPLIEAQYQISGRKPLEKYRLSELV